ncbi:MAG: aromatic-ring-hydroxylating dioxygenase subunit beta [Novosphingobium sp.]
MSTVVETGVTRAAIEDFLYEEAALADAHDYAGWLTLWAEDGRYWAPANDDAADERMHVALINDDYDGLKVRVTALSEGLAHALAPRARISRTIANVRFKAIANGLVEARAVFDLTSFRRHTFEFFAGRVVWHLRPGGESFRIVRKAIYLVNNDGFLPNMTFLL